MKKPALFNLLPILTILSLLVSCSSTPVDENDPQSLMADAEAEVEGSHYLIAIDKFRVVKNKFPYSKLAPLAQLRIADVYFMQESFIEAAMAYETFRDLHPKHERLAYAGYRIGLSYYQDVPSNVARDLASAHRAQEAFQEYLKQYPKDENAAEATRLVEEIKKTLAEKELYIARFYERSDQPRAAETRYKKVAIQFPGTPAALEAETRLKALTP